MSRPKKIRNNPFKAHIVDCIQRFLQNTPNTDAALLGNFDELGLSQVNKTKIMMKVINDNLNKEFVRVIFDDLPDKKQQYLVMKYKKDYSAVKIRVQLDVSYDCQCRWNNEIIQSIEKYDVLLSDKGRFTELSQGAEHYQHPGYAAVFL